MDVYNIDVWKYLRWYEQESKYYHNSELAEHRAERYRRAVDWLEKRAQMSRIKIPTVKNGELIDSFVRKSMRLMTISDSCHVFFYPTVDMWRQIYESMASFLKFEIDEISLRISHVIDDLKIKISAINQLIEEYKAESLQISQSMAKGQPIYQKVLEEMGRKDMESYMNVPDIVEAEAKEFSYVDIIVKELVNIQAVQHLVLLKTRIEASPNENVQPNNKIQWNEDQNALVTMFFDMKGMSMIKTTHEQIADVINRSFVDKEGKEITKSYILKLLKPSGKSFHSDKRIDMSDFN